MKWTDGRRERRPSAGDVMVGEFVGWVAIVFSVADVAWAIWSASREGPGGTEAPSVVPVAFTPERGREIGDALRGKPKPPHIQKMLRRLFLGRKHSAETRAKISATHRALGTRPRGRKQSTSLIAEVARPTDVLRKVWPMRGTRAAVGWSDHALP